MVAFGEGLKARGKLLAAESLKSDAQATRIESRNGKRAVVDGPFSEAKEMIGGFFLLDCQSHDEALAIAAECPAAEWATVEIRETGPCFRSEARRVGKECVSTCRFRWSPSP